MITPPAALLRHMLFQHLLSHSFRIVIVNRLLKPFVLSIVAIPAVALCLTTTWTTPASADDWPQFRGINGSSYLSQANPPDKFDSASGEGIAWKVELPGSGVGGPIVVGDRVYTTSSYGMEQRRISITANDANSGIQLWNREFKTTGRPYCHPTSANAAPTPATDGKHIVAFFSSNDLICLDLQGQLKWYRGLTYDYPKAANDVGMSSSPLIVDGVVVVQIECQADSFAAGIDLETGENLWRLERPRRANWASPIAFIDAEGKPNVLLQSSSDALAVNPRSGATVWKMDMACSSIPSATPSGDKLIVPSGGLTLLDMRQKGEPKKLWSNNKLNPNSGSALSVGDRIFAVNRSVLVSANLTDGELISQTRLPDAGTIWATPVATDRRMYIFTEPGKCFVLAIDQAEPELLGAYDLGESVLGSPALSGDAIFVRAKNHLWKLGAK